MEARRRHSSDDALGISRRQLRHDDIGAISSLLASWWRLTTFSDLVSEARERDSAGRRRCRHADDDTGLDAGGTGATAYAEAVSVYLAFAVIKLADYSQRICDVGSASDEAMRSTFRRQAIPMAWDFAEANPFCDVSR